MHVCMYICMYLSICRLSLLQEALQVPSHGERDPSLDSHSTLAIISSTAPHCFEVECFEVCVPSLVWEQLGDGENTSFSPYLYWVLLRGLQSEGITSVPTTPFSFLAQLTPPSSEFTPSYPIDCACFSLTFPFPLNVVPCRPLSLSDSAQLPR